MKKPVLVIMAAGMGSRYGGLKQIDPVDKEGHIIMDFSIYDAVQAGFRKVVFIIKKENEADFRSAIGDRLSNQLEVSYVFQDLHNIPEGYEVPEGRVKPWGTGHAVLSCINEIDGPFVVINADDYYGSHAFKMAYDFLTENEDTADTYRYMMVGYKLENTLTENGHVARGVCVTDEEGHLLKINERTHIEKHDGGTAYTEDDGKTWTMLPEGSTVSMNMWGFSASILKELKDRFPKFLDENLKVNPLKCEYFLPFVVDELLQEKKAAVRVLTTQDKWYGVTYKEDKPVVVAARPGRHPHLVQRLLQIDHDLAAIGKGQGDHAPRALAVHIGIRGVVDAITTALDGKQQLFGVVHEFEVGHYNLRMLKAPQILVRTLVLAASAAALFGCGQRGPLYLPTGPAASQRATLPQTLTPGNNDTNTAPSPAASASQPR